MPKRPGFLVDWRNAVAGPANVNQCGQLNSISREFPSRMKFVSSPVRQGSVSLSMEVQDDDVDHSSRERVQLRPTNPPRTYFSEGEEIWLAFSVWLHSDFYIPAIIGVDDAVILDGFPNTSDLKGGGLSTVVSVVIGPGSGVPKWVLSVNGGKSVEGGPYPHNTDQSFDSPTKETWHDFLLRCKFSSGEDGLVELWHDETPQTDARGIMPTFSESPTVKDTGPNVAVSTSGTVFVMYPQFGIYRHTNPQASTMFFGGVSAQATREMAEALWH